MDKQKSIAAAAETEEDRLLLARIYDRLTHGANRDIFATTGFLSPREQALVQRLLPHVPLVFFGGCQEAERRMACYVPEYLPEDYLTSDDGPVAAVRAEYYEKDALTHRDILGSLMALGLTRETLGDILVFPRWADVLATAPAAELLLSDWTDAGRVRLHTAEAVTSGRVQVNWTDCQKPDRPVAQGDTLTLRGLGKCVLEEVGHQTKKGRVFVTLKRYL